MNAPTLTRRSFTKGAGGILLAFSLMPADSLAQGATARLLVKTPGRARLELLLVDGTDADRPAAMVKDDRLAGRGGLEQQPAVAALVRALAMLAREEGLLGYRFEGQRYDAGDRLGYLKANVAFALKRPELAGPLRQALRELL